MGMQKALEVKSAALEVKSAVKNEMEKWRGTVRVVESRQKEAIDKLSSAQKESEEEVAEVKDKMNELEEFQEKMKEVLEEKEGAVDEWQAYKETAEEMLKERESEVKPLKIAVSRLVREVEELKEQRGEVKSKKKEKKRTAAAVTVVSGNDAERGDGDDGAFFSDDEEVLVAAGSELEDLRVQLKEVTEKVTEDTKFAKTREGAMWEEMGEMKQCLERHHAINHVLADRVAASEKGQEQMRRAMEEGQLWAVKEKLGMPSSDDEEDEDEEENEKDK